MGASEANRESTVVITNSGKSYYPPLSRQNLRRLHDHLLYNRTRYPTPLERLAFIQTSREDQISAHIPIESVPATHVFTSRKITKKRAWEQRQQVDTAETN